MMVENYLYDQNEYEYKSREKATRYANICQDCGSTKQFASPELRCFDTLIVKEKKHLPQKIVHLW